MKLSSWRDWTWQVVFELKRSMKYTFRKFVLLRKPYLLRLSSSLNIGNWFNLGIIFFSNSNVFKSLGSEKLQMNESFNWFCYMALSNMSAVSIRLIADIINSKQFSRAPPYILWYLDIPISSYKMPKSIFLLTD